MPPFLLGDLVEGQTICLPVRLLTGNTIFSLEVFSLSSEAI